MSDPTDEQPETAQRLPAELSDELRRRAAEIDSGAVKPVPWDEVRKQVQAQLDAKPD